LIWELEDDNRLGLDGLQIIQVGYRLTFRANSISVFGQERNVYRASDIAVSDQAACVNLNLIGMIIGRLIMQPSGPSD